jgi:hypothetical protein
MLLKNTLCLSMLAFTMACSGENTIANSPEKDLIIGKWVSEGTTVESYEFSEDNEINFETFFNDNLIGRQLGSFSRVSPETITLSTTECYVDDNLTDNIENLKRNNQCEGVQNLKIILTADSDSLYIIPEGMPLTSSETKSMKRVN